VPPAATPDARPPRLVLRVAIYTAAAFAVAALATLLFVRHDAVGRAEGQVGSHARFVAATILRDKLRPSDFAAPVSPARRARLDVIFRHEVLTGGVLRVKLYTPHARVTYSNDHGLIGTIPDEHEDIEEAFRGETLRDVSRLNHEGGAGPDRKVLEVYTPLSFAGRTTGVFEIYQDYAPVARSIRDEVYPIAIILFVALVALFLALFPLLRRTTAALLRSLGEQRRSREALESAEEQLRQAQKMEAVGQLAGGVAHDFNNLLLAIRGSTELALAGLADGNDAVREDLLRIQEASEGASELTRRLLAFSRRQVLHPRVLNMNKAVSSLVPMLRRLIGAHVRIETELHALAAWVRADPVQIEQVLVNLSVNARDAMPDGGTLTIRTRNVGDAGNRQVELAVADTGHGIDAETRSHLFEPFFTTKAEGRGTGLGLSTVYGIVVQSGGEISVVSEPGEGAEFRIHLPQVDAPAGEDPVFGAQDAPRGEETIMLVEDDEPVRLLLVRMLEGLGYTVIPTADGHEGLRIFDEEAARIDLVLTDVVLPVLSGPRLVEAVRARRPGARILYVSGYAGDTFERENVRPGDPFLSKPFSAADLARKVRETLDQTQPRIPSPVEISAA
jgi:signal transduction histidine kinase/ActR/RegA family two-component response regulator